MTIILFHCPLTLPNLNCGHSAHVYSFHKPFGNQQHPSALCAKAIKKVPGFEVETHNKIAK